jgi:hypothetical protein
MWKDRQLRDYRKANGLCFKCGEKFDPTHQCQTKQAPELHAITTEETPEQLSEEVLNMLELLSLAIQVPTPSHPGHGPWNVTMAGMTG